MNPIAQFIAHYAQPIAIVIALALTYILVRFLYVQYSASLIQAKKKKVREEFDRFCIGFVKDIKNCTSYYDLIQLKIQIDAFNEQYKGVVKEPYRFDSMKEIYTFFHQKFQVLKPKAVVHR